MECQIYVCTTPKLIGIRSIQLNSTKNSPSFNSRTCSELQTARIGLIADLSTAGGLAAGTLQLIGWVPKVLEFAIRGKLFQLLVW